jgi:hypothetical protein
VLKIIPAKRVPGYCKISKPNKNQKTDRKNRQQKMVKFTTFRKFTRKFTTFRKKNHTIIDNRQSLGHNDKLRALPIMDSLKNKNPFRIPCVRSSTTIGSHIQRGSSGHLRRGGGSGGEKRVGTGKFSGVRKKREMTDRNETRGSSD